MKKILSLMLCLVLLISTIISAAAAPDGAGSTLDERLKAITLSVKETLGIGDDFSSFNGSLDEYTAVSLWSLSWSKDDEQLYVSANENGTIVSYHHYISDNGTQAPRGNIPRFPKISFDEAKAIALAFLDKVLDKAIESVELQGNSNLDYSGNAVFYMNGTIKLFGIEAPVGISVSVSSAAQKVTSFYRSDSGQDYSGVTKPAAASDKAAAAAALKSTLNMKLTYALPGDGTHTARLQYQPKPDGSYVVDAVTGQLVDLSKLDWSSDSRPGMSSKDLEASASAAPESGGLTTVEQAAVDKLQGVLSQSELEKNIRAYPELGLTSELELRYVNYYTYEEENEETQVTATLEFTYRPEDDTTQYQYRYVTMDARTGRLISLSSNRIYIDANGEEAVSYKYAAEQTEATARSFAGKILPDELKQTALSQENESTADGARYYAFLRTHDSIFFPENYINVGVDANTGYVVSFYSNWYKFDVTFVSSAGAISADTAAEKYAAAVGTTLRYVGVPASTNESGLLLAYTAADTTVWGVNALTGELLKAEVSEDEGLRYNDIDGNPYAAIINKLASYGVGFPGDSFKPDAQLTQLDALTLLVSANGQKVVPLPMNDDNIEYIYNTAYSMGILTPDEKNPTKAITRAEFTKDLVNGLGYGDVAKLPGIFKAGFRDDKTIPAALMGYVAISRGLGIVNGDEKGNFKPNDIANRMMAAIMLYNCMSRK